MAEEICFDLDDVVKPLVNPRWLAKIEEVEGVHLPYESITSFWDMEDYLYLLGPEYFDHEVGEPEPGAYPLIQTLVDHGHKVYILSATHHTNISAKTRWLIKNLPMLEEKNFIWGRSKGLVASHGRILVDDAVHNLQEFEDRDGISICYTRPWNHDWKSHRRVSNFSDLGAMFSRWGII